jgi:Tfp pilus assembly protein PilP
MSRSTINHLAIHFLASTLVFGLWGQGKKEKVKPVDSAPPAVEAETTGNANNSNKDTQPTLEDLVARKAIPYRPTINRDPFAAPSDAEPSKRGDMVDDIAVKGIIKREGKFFAVVTDSRGNVRFIPSGYKFRDGEIVTIDDKAVVFHQWDPNSTVKTQYKTITKTFKREEGKR